MGAHASVTGMSGVCRQTGVCCAAAGEERYSFAYSAALLNAIRLSSSRYITSSMFQAIVSYYVDLKEGRDIDGFNRRIASACSLAYYSNFRETSDTASKSYINILSFATVIVIIVSLIIAGFILYILISVYLSNKKREHGILKSLGFVTKDILYQTVVSILPTCIIAAAAGLWLSRNGSAKILILALRKIGIFSFGSQTDVIWLIFAGVGITVFTVGYSLILSSSVRRITPHQLFNKE